MESPVQNINSQVHGLHCLDGDHHEQLDFEDENVPVSTINNFPTIDDEDLTYLSNDDSSSTNSVDQDEGEMKSDDESESANDCRSSEEGEIQSEVDDVDIVLASPQQKEETPWERGLRLARERLERAKAFKAKEKDLVDKRMNLSIPVPQTEREPEKALTEDVFWCSYYQASIIGRTELTSRRYLPQDLAPPSVAETAEWRRIVNSRTDRHLYRRHCSSRSGSSATSSASSYSSGISSTSSSLASVAASWKATCAAAMRLPLSSGRMKRGNRHHDHESSASNSPSSYSRSGSRRSPSAKVRGSFDYSVGLKGSRGRYPLQISDHRGGRIKSDSERSSSESDSRATKKIKGSTIGSFHSFNSRNVGGVHRQSPLRSSPIRRRPDAPPLPSERPVKRPWMAAPTLLSSTFQSGHTKDDRSRSSSQSCSPPEKVTDEKHFITSWSRSPSSGDEVREHPRRDRLPDVVAGTRINKIRHSATIKRRKSRSPFAEDLTNSTIKKWDESNENSSTLDSGTQNHLTNEHLNIANYDTAIPNRIAVGHDSTQMNTTQSVHSTGELPPNRPGVRLTLAPRLKAPAVNMSSFTGGSSRTTAVRQNSPSPQPSRQPRSGFPPFRHQKSPTEQNQTTVTAPSELNFSMTQARIQAEAAAAALEARERRRAAAEAARNHHRHRHRKHNDLEKIPIRGRPTYRRQSFSNSSVASGSSVSSAPRSTSRANSRSAPGRAPLLRVSSPNAPKAERDPVHRMPPSKRGRFEQLARPRGINDSNNNYRRRQELRGTEYAHPDIREPMDFQRLGRTDQLQRGGFPSTPQRYREREQRLEPNDLHKSTKRVYPLNIDEPIAYSARQRLERDPKSNNRYSGLAYNGEEAHRYAGPDFRRSRPHPYLSTSNKGRLARIRTPHTANTINVDFSRRSPHAGFDILPRPREQRRVNYDIAELSAKERVHPNHPDADPSTADMRRARSRHRSRGPGGLIDRSEPFESDAGSVAAEQRLRELRERLNLVDDAIAEIKAGTGSSQTTSHMNVRR